MTNKHTANLERYAYQCLSDLKARAKTVNARFKLSATIEINGLEVEITMEGHSQ